MRNWIKKNRLRIIVTLSILIAVLLAGLAGLAWNYINSMKPLAERLGYSRNDRLLIVNADDCGMCADANRATFDAMANGMVTSATIMVPCPALDGVVAEIRRNPKLDLGIHLTHTSEWSTYRWVPVAPQKKVPGLCRADGTMWREAEDTQAHASCLEAYREGKAQIEKIMALGLKPTHLDSHMGTMQTKFSYFFQYIRLGWEFDLPLRMPSPETLDRHHAGFLRSITRLLGIVSPDYLVLSDYAGGVSTKDYWLEVLKHLEPGVTEIYIHPSRESEEMKKITHNWKRRAEEYQLFLNDPDIRRTMQEHRIILIGYSSLYNLQRGVK